MRNFLNNKGYSMNIVIVTAAILLVTSSSSMILIVNQMRSTARYIKSMEALEAAKAGINAAVEDLNDNGVLDSPNGTIADETYIITFAAYTNDGIPNNDNILTSTGTSTLSGNPPITIRKTINVKLKNQTYMFNESFSSTEYKDKAPGITTASWADGQVTLPTATNSIWTTSADFNNNASTTGETTTRNQVSTTGDRVNLVPQLTITNQNTPSTSNYKGVFFTSGTTGYATRYDNKIIKTTNAGVSWNEVYSGGPVLYDIYFSTANTGYAVGGGTVIKTTDAGNTWQAISTGVATNLFAVQFTDVPNIGFAGGMQSSKILKTIDAGNTWSTVNSPSKDVTNIYFADSNTGYASGYNGLLLKTTNSGVNWTTISSGQTATIWGLFFTSASTGYLSNYVTSSLGQVRKTINGGTSWSSVNLPRELNDIFFATSSTGYGVGPRGIFQSTNSGASWTQIDSTQWLDSVHFPTPQAGWAVGDSGAIRKISNLLSSPGTISNLKMRSGTIGQRVSWLNISWISDALPANASISFRARTSNDNQNWSSWSNYFAQSSAGSTSGAGDLSTLAASEFLELEMRLESTDGINSPALNSFRVESGSTTGRAQSIAVTNNNGRIIRATLTPTATLNNQTIDYMMRANNGANWQDVIDPGSEISFTNPGEQLRWRADLETTDTSVSPVLDQVDIKYVVERYTINYSTWQVTSPNI